MKKLTAFTSLIFLVCGIAAGIRLPFHSECIDGSDQPSAAPEAPGKTVDLIWQGSLGQRTISWTTADLTIEGPENGRQEIFSSLAAQDFTAWLKNDLKLAKCDYTREFRILSVVGNLLTFEDKRKVVAVAERGNYAGLAEEIHFKTIDITRSVTQNKGIGLTGYFSEKEILNGLLKDPDIRAAWVEQRSERLPKSLRQFLSGLGSGLFLKNYRYVIYDNFLSEFVFEEVRGDKVKVKLIFPNSQSKNFDYIGISFYLTIPSKLWDSLYLAAGGEAGFLAAEAGKNSGGKVTKIKFNCEE
jgi:hypothetical protein